MSRLSQVAGALLVAALLGLMSLRAGWIVRHSRVLAPVIGGDPAPPFRLPLLGGGEFALARGEISVVDFWATWCAPCRAELPHIDALHRRYRDRGVRVVAVDAEEESMRPQVEALADSLHLSMPIALGGEEVSGLYKVTSLPTVAIVARDGTIARVLFGIHEDAELDRIIEGLLAR